MKNMKLLVLIILFLIVASIETVLVIHLITNGKNEPEKEKTVEELKESEAIRRLREMPYKHGNLKEIEYSRTVPNTGYTEKMILKRVNSSYRLFYYEKQDSKSKTKVTEYTADPVDYMRILNYNSEYNLPAWSTLGKRDKQEGDIKQVKIVYDDSKQGKSNNEEYIISNNMVFPEKGYKIVSTFVDYLYSARKDKNIVNTKEI